VTTLTLTDISKEMRRIDFAMLFTRTEGGELAGRPMSNNGEVDFEGDCYFFTYDHTRMVQDVERDPKVALSYQGSAGLLGKPPMFIAIEGFASLVRQKTQFVDHWTKDLDRWFPEGIDTKGLLMIRVDATRIHYWNGEDEGEIPLAPARTQS
jgi:general stress protein 26